MAEESEIMPENSQLDEILEKADLEFMLEFETQIFLDILHTDGLVVAAKGLNLDLVVLNILKVHCDPGNLVIVLNSTESEDQYFIENIKTGDVHRTTSTTNSTVEREDVYLSGGIHLISTRLLVVDMLKKRIPIDKITGFVILRAHKIIESCQEAFVLRLFRQSNKTGFIKAFSNSVQSFTVGFGHVERIMRTIFVKELFIWPRFHSTVIKSLKPHEPQVIELHIPVSENVRKVQTIILDLMNLTVKELKRLNKTVELQEITVENCLTKQFQKILQLQLDTIWYQLNRTSMQLVADLKTLRHLLLCCFYSDSVSFYHILSGYRSMEYAQNATWVLQKPADLLFTNAAALVFTGDREFNPELSPKWTPLLELLKNEIPQQIKKQETNDNTILILCADNKTCYQLNQLLSHGPYYYLFRMAIKLKVHFKTVNERFRNFENMSLPLSPKKPKLSEPQQSTSSEKQDTEEDPEEVFKSSYLLTMSQNISLSDLEEDEYVFEPFAEMENMNFTQICESLTAPKVIIQTFKGEGKVNLQRNLQELSPSFIVMYHSDLVAIREIEMYEAHRAKGAPLKVFFLIHGGTVEEQSYLTSMRREKEAFEHLIQTKSTMIVPEDQDGKTETCTSLQRDLRSPQKSTRQGGCQDEAPPRRFVIVDMREFRSELPALIHKRGLDVEPVTITVGDYILTPEICVERKSISDLIGSLNSGRLYQQCIQMSRCYQKPMLLIEFDQNKPFSWQSHFMVSSDSNNFDIQQKLLLLTLHFPKLKLIWSPSPYASAQLFEELKNGKEEPNLEYAAAIGAELDLDVVEAKYNTNIYDFVQKLPGINSKNIDGFMRRMGSLSEVLDAEEQDFKEVLGNSADTQLLVSALFEDHNPKETEIESTKQKVKSMTRFKNKGKKRF